MKTILFYVENFQGQDRICDLDCQHLNHPEEDDIIICVALGTFKIC
jgi:hypothetical protein